jgi:transposase-like protein
MLAIALKCPFCASEDVRTYGTSNGKKRYAWNNPSCFHKTFYAEYRYNGCKPEVKKEVIKRAAGQGRNTGDGTGMRGKSRYGYKRIKKEEDKRE